jgi:antitoxin (DNA-binding transcriptional repressor) of toxin-antitoxin stability system
MTIHVPIKQFKNRLSEYGRLAAEGERVIVTNRGKPQFELGAVRPERNGFNYEALAKWRAEKGYADRGGWVAPDFDDPLPEDFLITPQAPEFWDGPKS